MNPKILFAGSIKSSLKKYLTGELSQTDEDKDPFYGGEASIVKASMIWS